MATVNGTAALTAVTNFIAKLTRAPVNALTGAASLAANATGSPSDSVAGTGSVSANSTTSAKASLTGAGAMAPVGVLLTPYTPYFCTNLCTNPSFETDLTGYTAIGPTQLTRTSQDAVSGQYSMKAVTSGSTAPEGFFGPNSVPFAGASQAALAMSFWGESGVLQISAVTNPGGIILATQTLDLAPFWQRVTFDNLFVNYQGELYILVETPFAQDLAFLCDAQQAEPETPAKPYIDGNSPGAVWLGTINESASQQQYQFPIYGRGGMFLEGTAQVIEAGEMFQISGTGGMELTGGAVAADFTTLSPAAALDDFAMWPSTDVDPALSYVSWNNANATDGQTSYNQPWGIFYPPLDYQVSDGSYLWKRAAFGAIGWEMINVGAGVSKNLTMVQLEKKPLAGTFDDTPSNPSPAPYETPRALHTIVKPARLNYCTNPSFETSTAGWTATNCTLTRSTSVFYDPDLGEYDGMALSAGSCSGQVSQPSGGDGFVSIAVPELIPGDIYIASLWFLIPASGVLDLVMSADSTTSQSLANGADLPPGWVQQSVIFEATATIMNVFAGVITDTSATYPVVYNVDACLIEAGEVIGPYFDGNFSNPDYMWETGGTASLSRSYYYPNFASGQAAVNDVLTRHVPVGQTALPPLYAVPYTQ